MVNGSHVVQSRSSSCCRGRGADRSYTGSYKLYTSGVYQLSVVVHDAHVAGSPFTLEIGAGRTNLSSFVAYGPGVSGGVAGEELVGEVQAKDSWGNDVVSDVSGSGVALEGTLEYANGGSVPGVSVSVEYSGNGRYTFRYTVITSGMYSLSLSGAGE